MADRGDSPTLSPKEARRKGSAAKEIFKKVEKALAKEMFVELFLFSISFFVSVCVTGWCSLLAELCLLKSSSRLSMT